MAKFLVNNKLGAKNTGFNVASTGLAPVQSFCDAHLEGEYVLFERTSVSGNASVPENYLDTTITVKNKTGGEKATFRALFKETTDEVAISAALFGKVINGINVDEVYIINMSLVKVA